MSQRLHLEAFRNSNAAGVNYAQTFRLYPNTIRQLILVLGGGTPPTKAQVSRIQIKLGTSVKPIWDITGPQLLDLCEYEGRPSTATVFCLPFANFRARTIEAEMVTALDMGAVGVRDLNIEVTLTGGVTPLLDWYADIAPPKQYGEGAVENRMFRCLLRTPLQFSAAINRSPQVLSTGANGGASLRRIIFDSGLVTAFEHQREGIPYYEDTPLVINNAVNDELNHDPQANTYAYDIIRHDDESDSLPQVRQDENGLSLVPQQFLVSVSGAGTFDAIADINSTLDGL